MHRPDAEPAQLLRDTGGHGATLLQGGDVLKGKAAVAVVLSGTGGEVRRMSFSEGNKALAWLRQWLYGEVHNTPPQPSPFFLRECGMIVNLFLRRRVNGQHPADPYRLQHTHQEDVTHGSSRSSNDAVGP
jgi:hypothetical protein